MRSALPVTTATLIFVITAPALAVEDPIDYPGKDPTIRLEVLGTYRGNAYNSGSSIEPAAYDPIKKRLFVVSQDRGGVDVIDIRDPSTPQKIGPDPAVSEINVSNIGLPAFVAVKGRIVAVALENTVQTDPGYVAFFDLNHLTLTDPDDTDDPVAVVQVGAQPSMVTFTPNGRYVVVASSGEANDEYIIDPSGSISIIELRRRGHQLTTSVITDNFSSFNDQEEDLRASGVRIFGPNATVSQDLEPQSIAVSDDSRTAWVTMPTNNALAVVDIKAAAVVDILPFGYKDHSVEGNGLDASDQDGGISIRTWPVQGIYQPDVLAAYRAFGKTYLVTPNEGNPRNTTGFSERVRVRDLTLDPTAFPNAADLKSNANLGRLRVTNVQGDTDGEYPVDFEELYSFGGRSFAIWTTDAELVFDSGDDFEQITDEAVKDKDGNSFFNSEDNNNAFDSRSDDGGPEVEAVAVGRVGLRQYAFIILEQVGGVMVYDITHPQEPRFQLYFNNRDFSVDPGEEDSDGNPVVCGDDPRVGDCPLAGDLGPEGVLFIPRWRSPIRAPLLVMTHEISDTTTILKIERNR
jgi:2',3'-cyclic-nucleotide 2'-phosphodiesterase / 3'-nucleotidase / 5'-nucleotidase